MEIALIITLNQVHRRSCIYERRRGEARHWYQQLVFKKLQYFFFFLSSSSEERDRERNGGKRERGDWSNETAWSQPPFRSHKHPRQIFRLSRWSERPVFSPRLPAFMFHKPDRKLTSIGFYFVDNLQQKLSRSCATSVSMYIKTRMTWMVHKMLQSGGFLEARNPSYPFIQKRTSTNDLLNINHI